MHLYLVHHGVAVGADEDARRPLSAVGLAGAARVAAKAAALGAKPDVVWHSGKLRAKQTGAGVLARVQCARGIFGEPGSAAGRSAAVDARSPSRRDADIAIAGHFPHLPRLLALLTTGGEAGVDFPINGIVALVSEDEGETWRELWRIEN